MIPDLPPHGGGLDGALSRWPDYRGQWLDLSTGINPESYPLPTLPPHIWQRLPDQHLDRDLRQAASARYGAPDSDHVLASSGSGAVIRALPLTLPKSDVAILGPTYGEHQTAWQDAGHHVRLCETLDQAARVTVLVVVNPNNPDGRIIDPARLAEFAQCHPQTLLVVDQAFGDTAPSLSLIPHLPENAMVLTSFGKFFGLAGLRLGLVFAAPHRLAPLARHLGPWPVSGPALVIGARALDDSDWIKATRIQLQSQAQDLDRRLSEAGLEIVGGTSLFRLIRHDQAYDLWDHLGQVGILTRVFDYRPQWLRLGLPADEPASYRLAQALADWSNKSGWRRPPSAV